MNVALKPIRLENGNGEELRLCDCFGSGVLKTTEIERQTSSGKTYRAGQHLNEQDAKLFKRKDWGFRSESCPHCKGAGMVKVEGQQ